jgi:ATP/maltotriose-dependent transcriptional regulator MalT
VEKVEMEQLWRVIWKGMERERKVKVTEQRGQEMEKKQTVQKETKKQKVLNKRKMPKTEMLMPMEMTLREKETEH